MGRQERFLCQNICSPGVSLNIETNRAYIVVTRRATLYRVLVSPPMRLRLLRIAGLVGLSQSDSVDLDICLITELQVQVFYILLIYLLSHSYA